ncbi:hypothetical protein M3Y97_00233200 [Aphelenchoides bicaudatus]|nr:hypothetical protein M3Y97_00233200 [Aphelenchoides bicaudatus]
MESEVCTSGCKKGRVKQFMKKCMNLLADALPPAIGHRQKYTIEQNVEHKSDSKPGEVCLLQAQKLSDKLTPIEILIVNFCHTIDDIKLLQKQKERLSFLNLKPEELENVLVELLFVFEKRSCIEAAASRLKTKKLNKKSEFSQRF